jgi:hypothetical protein
MDGRNILIAEHRPQEKELSPVLGRGKHGKAASIFLFHRRGFDLITQGRQATGLA